MGKAPKSVSLEDVPGAPPRGSVLCTLSELGSREAKTLTFTEGHFRFALFVQRWDDAVYVYKNSCPHVRLPLDFRPGQFLDPKKKHLYCANHGALFRVEDGACIKGPCKGQYLTPIRFQREGDNILVG